MSTFAALLAPRLLTYYIVYTMYYRLHTYYYYYVGMYHGMVAIESVVGNSTLARNQVSHANASPLEPTGTGYRVDTRSR